MIFIELFIEQLNVERKFIFQSNFLYVIQKPSFLFPFVFLLCIFFHSSHYFDSCSYFSFPKANDVIDIIRRCQLKRAIECIIQQSTNDSHVPGQVTFSKWPIADGVNSQSLSSMSYSSNHFISPVNVRHQPFFLDLHSPFLHNLTNPNAAQMRVFNVDFKFLNIKVSSFHFLSMIFYEITLYSFKKFRIR